MNPSPLLVLFTLFFLPMVANAAIVVRPQVNGVSTVASIPVGMDGHLKYQGQGVWNPVTRSYSTSGAFGYGGRTLTLPAKVSLSSGAASFVKNAMRLNPYAVVGTLALSWLMSEGIDFVNSEWKKTDRLLTTNMTGCLGPAYKAELIACLTAAYPGYVWDIQTINTINYVTRNGAGYGYWQNYGGPTQRPAVQSDWDALPDPIPTVGGELPAAPYMDGGAPVNPPEYSPSDIPLGVPYKKPDGSTVEPRAQVTPNGDGTVTLDGYDKPVTDSAGNPAPDQTPQDISEPPPDPCESNPDRIGCLNAGTDDYAMPTKPVVFSYAPESSVIAGSCPAPIQVLGHSLSYQPACNAMTTIRPLILGLAGVMAAYILIGAFKET